MLISKDWRMDIARNTFFQAACGVCYIVQGRLPGSLLWFGLQASIPWARQLVDVTKIIEDVGCLHTQLLETLWLAISRASCLGLLAIMKSVNELQRVTWRHLP